MAKWYLVTFEPATGKFTSPSCCEPAVAAHQCLQCRFDNVGGVSLIKCIRPGGFPPDPMVEEIDPNTDIVPWLETIARLQSGGGYYDKEGVWVPPVYFTVDEEESLIKNLARNFN